MVVNHDPKNPYPPYTHAWDQRNRDYQQKMKDDFERAFGPKPTCLPPMTPILTPHGNISLDKIDVGDHVLSYDLTADSLVPRMVKKKKQYSSATLWKICTENMEAMLMATASHSFLTENGWKRVNSLACGDRLFWIDGQCRKMALCIAKIENTNVRTNVYNLVTEVEHSFIAYGFLSHNFSFLRPMRAFISNLNIKCLYNAHQYNGRAMNARP